MSKHRQAVILMSAILTLTVFAGSSSPSNAAPAQYTAKSPTEQTFQSYISFKKWSTQWQFSKGSRRHGTVVGSSNGQANVHLASSNLITGTNSEQYGRSWYKYGTLITPVITSAHPFDTAVASWNATTPKDTWIKVGIRAYRPSTGRWTKFYMMGVWSSRNDMRYNGKVFRHSVANQGDSLGTVSTDTLLLWGKANYTRYQVRLTLFTTNTSVSPHVRMLSVFTSNTYKQTRGLNLPSDHKAWGMKLNVPRRSQMVYSSGDGWCSPTSTSMVLAHWGHNVTVPYAASSTYDSTYQGNGNWPFNTGFVGSYSNMEGYVVRMSSMSQVEEWIQKGIPVEFSFAWKQGELDNAPIPSSNGHIAVIVGFTRNGDVIVNDPASSNNSSVTRVYDRNQLIHAWLRNSGGTTYIVYPRGHVIPNSMVWGSWQP